MKNDSMAAATLIFMFMPTFLGFFLFYLAPLGFTLYYSFVDGQSNFVMFNNYKSLLSNQFFILAAKNSVKFIVISVPLNIILALLLALWIQTLKGYTVFYIIVFLLPMAIPTAATGYFWTLIFKTNGWLNGILLAMQLDAVNWLESEKTFYVALFIFLWKNIGYNLIIFISGLNSIPSEYYEYAHLEGGNAFQIFIYIKSAFLLPAFFNAIIMSLINSFKIYKETYVILGNYPTDSIYTLQHYLNNVFFNIDYQKLSSATYLFLSLLVIILLILIYSRKFLNFYD